MSYFLNDNTFKRFILPFLAMDETPTNVIGHLAIAENPIQKDCTLNTHFFTQ